MIELVKKIIPEENEYDFRFENTDSCYKEKYGICPVILNKNNILDGTADFPQCKCVRLIQDIIQNGFIENTRACWIEIISSNSNLFEISNGRHRICAASKLKVPIIVHIYDETK